jgi:hypothetical protein
LKKGHEVAVVKLSIVASYVIFDVKRELSPFFKKSFGLYTKYIARRVGIRWTNLRYQFNPRAGWNQLYLVDRDDFVIACAIYSHYL